MWRSSLVAMVLVFSASLAYADWPGKRSEWNGYGRYDFEVNGHASYVITPKVAAPGRPWVWRARFPEYRAEIDIELLARGYHVGYTDVAGLFGSPEALSRGDAFYEFVTERGGLAERVALEGVSRGGLFVYNWAARNPEKVACTYADTPVCDIRSWPGGLGVGRGHAPTWEACLRVYGLTEAEVETFEGNPIDHLQPLAEAGIPLMSVVTENDQIVPPIENTYVLRERYEALGGEIAVVSIAEGTIESSGHHFPLQDPGPGADFICAHTRGTPHGHEYFEMRGGLDRCRRVFEREGVGRVAFLGGSITYNPGWRDLICADLQRRFADTEFDFVAAGIPSMGSTPGAFRLERDVLSQGGRVDLLFVEAAVNDAGNKRSATEQLRGMEGIVRHARRANPAMDIVMMHFVDPSKMETIRSGGTPEVIATHERVAEHYAVPSINLALEVTERIGAGEFTWKDDFRNLHPSPFGQKVYARSIRRLFDAAWGEADVEETVTPPAVPEPLDPFCYQAGRLVDIGAAELGQGWRYESTWRPTDGAATRAGFVAVPMLIAEDPGATLTFAFQGSAVGVFVAAGPDAGALEFRVDPDGDEGRWKKLDLFTPWSARLHLPWAHVLAAELGPGRHVLELRVSREKNEASRGHAVRVAHLLVNGPMPGVD
jgi:lysophospholipase L1-like esterase/pimeloyl-ACP methyl ester carboxylesterase